VSPSELKDIRKRLGLTQAELAKVLGVVPSTVAKWEQSIHPIDPTAARLLALLSNSK
jgi:DNA-binding transcriptional regulator YiaG